MNIEVSKVKVNEAKVSEVKVGEVIVNINEVIVNYQLGKSLSISYIVILTTIQGFGLNDLTKNPGFFITGLVFIGWMIYKKYFKR